MNNIRRIIWVIFGMIALMACNTTPATAQSNVFWVPSGTADYSVGSNWSTGFVPEADVFDERAVINNGGTAFVAATVLASSAILLGQNAGDSGTLEIRSGGNLPVALLAGNQGNGGVTVGAGGTGTLRVLPGGTLNADGPLVAGNAIANTVVLGGAGTGTATVNVGNATFGGTTQAFPNLTFNSAGQAAFTPTSVYTVNITAAGAPTMNSALSAVLNGTLNVNFSGVTPTLGSSWDLFHAGAVAGSFSAINVSGAPPLGPGQRYAVGSVPAANNRARGVLTLEQFLAVNVNRDTGAVQISNAGNQPFAFQAYTITSAAGSLNVSGWNSIDDQNALGGDWRESNPSANRLSELKPSGASTLPGANGISLGTAFLPNPPAFGVETEDLTFQYVKADGSLATGVVNYTGARVPNNLVLQVDPATGAAQLRNTSPFTVAIDGYTIASAFGSLSPSGWNSLDDQNAAGGDWRESNASATRLSELKPTASTTLGPGTTFNLGNPFSVGGMQDLVFDFLLFGQSTPFRGEVMYGAISATLPGDYNGDGKVDAADYVLWRKTDGTPAGYNTWRMNFGQTAGSGGGSALVGSSAVPEPHSWALLMLAAVSLWTGKRRTTDQR